MSFTALKERVCRINKEIVRAGLVQLTFGNASGADAGVMAIKPSGVDYDALVPDNIVVLDIATGKILEGTKRPSSDTPTHLHLYQKFPCIGGIVHTHSIHATSWAQAGRAIPCLGTTHADHFYGAVPVTRLLTRKEIAKDYELNTGKVIVETCQHPNEIPAVLVAGHAPFAWGTTPEKALENAIALEVVAQMARQSRQLNPRVKPISQALLDKHFLRKHGAAAYYGQP
jgi:L-ribulose-5-phosphate 4-epimerase